MDTKSTECIEQALRFLSIREHNKRELSLKLKKKGYDDSLIEKTVEFLTDSGDLDEGRYIESFVRSSNRRHPEGKAVVLQRLLAKGTEKRTAEAVLNELYTEKYTLQLLKEAKNNIRKKIMKAGKTKDEKEAEKMLKSKLLQLGFNLSNLSYSD